MDIPLIVKLVDDGKLQGDFQKLIEILKKPQGDFLILSIIGNRHSGKSFFINKIMKFLDPNLGNHGFHTNLAKKSENGVKIWPMTFKTKSASNPESNVIILDIDCRGQSGDYTFMKNYSILEIFCLSFSSLTIYLDKNEPASLEIDSLINLANSILPQIYSSNTHKMARKIIFFQNNWPIPHYDPSHLCDKLSKISNILTGILGGDNCTILPLNSLFIKSEMPIDEQPYLRQDVLNGLKSKIIPFFAQIDSNNSQDIVSLIEFTIEVINSKILIKSDGESQNIHQNPRGNFKKLKLSDLKKPHKAENENDISSSTISSIFIQNCQNHADIFVDSKKREKFVDILCHKIASEMVKKPQFSHNNFDDIYSWTTSMCERALRNWSQILSTLDKMSIMIEIEFDNYGAFSRDEMFDVLYRAKRFANSKYQKGSNEMDDQFFELLINKLCDNFKERNKFIIEKEKDISEEISKLAFGIYLDEMKSIEHSQISSKNEELCSILLEAFDSSCQKKSLMPFWVGSKSKLENELKESMVKLKQKTLEPKPLGKIVPENGSNEDAALQNAENQLLCEVSRNNVESDLNHSKVKFLQDDQKTHIPKPAFESISQEVQNVSKNTTLQNPQSKVGNHTLYGETGNKLENDPNKNKIGSDQKSLVSIHAYKPQNKCQTGIPKVSNKDGTYTGKNLTEMSENSKIVGQNRPNQCLKNSKNEELPEEKRNLEILKNAIENYNIKVWGFLQNNDITFATFISFHEISRQETFHYLESNLSKNLKADVKSKFKDELGYQIETLKVKFLNEVPDEIKEKPIDTMDEGEIKAADNVKIAIELYSKNVSEFLDRGKNINFTSFKGIHDLWKANAIKYFDSYLPQKLSAYSTPRFKNFLEKDIGEMHARFLAKLKIIKSESKEAIMPEMKKNLNKISIGIHFGTKFMRCGIYSDSKVVNVENTKGVFVFRNFVTIKLKDGKRYFMAGENAENEYLKNPGDFEVNYYGNGSFVANDNKLPKLKQVEYIVAFLLQNISQSVKRVHDGEIQNCVIALPTSSDYFFRNVVLNAATIVGFNNVHIVSEPMAAAYTTAHNRELSTGVQFLVLTHGKNQFDSAILQVQINQGKVNTVSGRAYLPNYKPNHLSFEETLINRQENIDIVGDSLLAFQQKFNINLEQCDKNLYGILAGDHLPNDLQTFKIGLKKVFPKINLIDDYKFLEGIVQGATLLSGKFALRIYKPKNFVEVNPFNVSVLDPRGKCVYELLRNTEIPMEEFWLNHGIAGVFKFKYSMGRVDFQVNQRVDEIWIKIENSGLSITYMLNGKTVGHAKETNRIDDQILEEFKNKFKEYLSTSA